MAYFSPVMGRYVIIDVLGDECKVIFLENGSGQPLVCQHTAGCPNHQWRDLLEDEEITQDYRVIAYDLVTASPTRRRTGSGGRRSTSSPPTTTPPSSLPSATPWSSKPPSSRAPPSEDRSRCSSPYATRTVSRG
jgi:hypothetical protein